MQVIKLFPCLRKILFFNSLVFLASCSTPNKEEYIQFFEELTYLSSQWKEDDFGRTATQREESLLEKYAPAFWVEKGSCKPLNFYQQYVPLLFNEETGEKASRQVLKKYERDLDVYWNIKDPPECIESETPPLYAYSWQESLETSDGQSQKVTVLKYAFTFYKSGLPVKLPFPQGAIRFLGSLDSWHYLDIHGAIFYLLNENDELFSVVLAQHNHFRSFVVGVDVSEENARRLCYAIRTNEPYFCHDGSENKDYATAPTYQYIDWIITEKDRTFVGAWDVVPGNIGREPLGYRLELLSHRDPLITSWVPLGPEFKIWGLFSTFFRKSPPGMAIFNTPKLKRIVDTAQYFYFDPNDEQTFKLHEENSGSFLSPDIQPVFDINSKRFLENINLN